MAKVRIINLDFLVKRVSDSGTWGPVSQVFSNQPHIKAPNLLNIPDPVN